MKRGWLILPSVLLGCWRADTTTPTLEQPKPIGPPLVRQITCKPTFEFKKAVREFIQAENRYRIADQHWIVIDDGRTHMRVYWDDKPVPSVIDSSYSYRFSVRTTEYEVNGQCEHWHEIVKVDLLDTPLGREVTVLEVLDK